MKNFHYYGVKQCANHKGNTVERRVSISGVLSEDGLSIGVAECGSSDNFNRKLGREISTGRAIKRPIDNIERANLTEKPGQDFIGWCKNYCK